MNKYTVTIEKGSSEEKVEVWAMTPSHAECMALTEIATRLGYHVTHIAPVDKNGH